MRKYLTVEWAFVALLAFTLAVAMVLGAGCSTPNEAEALCKETRVPGGSCVAVCHLSGYSGVGAVEVHCPVDTAERP